MQTWDDTSKRVSYNHQKGFFFIFDSWPNIVSQLYLSRNGQFWVSGTEKGTRPQNPILSEPLTQITMPWLLYLKIHKDLRVDTGAFLPRSGSRGEIKDEEGYIW